MFSSLLSYLHTMTSAIVFSRHKNYSKLRANNKLVILNLQLCQLVDIFSVLNDAWAVSLKHIDVSITNYETNETWIRLARCTVENNFICCTAYER